MGAALQFAAHADRGGWTNERFDDTSGEPIIARTMIATSSPALGFFLIALYFVPTIVAFSREVVNAGSVLVINLFLGWTLIGWVVALAMAVRTQRTA